MIRTVVRDDPFAPEPALEPFAKRRCLLSRRHTVWMQHALDVIEHRSLRGDVGVDVLGAESVAERRAVCHRVRIVATTRRGTFQAIVVVCSWGWSCLVCLSPSAWSFHGRYTRTRRNL